MKKIIALPFLFLCVFSAIAQSPQAIPYQAVLRNTDGSVIANQTVTITFTIHNNAVDGTTEYQENHSTTSNALGLINLNVGQGTPSVGTFSAINWGSGTKFLQVAMNNGNGNIDLGTQQMLSVPYALYAENVGVRISVTGDTLVVGGHVVIVPGVSAANSLYQPGNGATDIDGNTYTSIIINGQEWIQQNLAVTKYRNGDPIPTGLSNSTWRTTTSGAYAIYNNDAAYNTFYGKLYNWHAVNDSRGLCPTGWHVPSDAEWSAFINFLDPNANGGDSFPNVAGGKMKATTGWTANTGATNESGFTGLPGGYRFTNGPYGDVGANGSWWSSTESDYNGAWIFALYYGYSSVDRGFYGIEGKQYGYSVRCVRD